eukprot:jgi/Botrbrau1/23059/Bobra.0243s0002.1
MSRLPPRWATAMPKDAVPLRSHMRSPSWGGFLGSIPDDSDEIDQAPPPDLPSEPLPWQDFFTNKWELNLPERKGSFNVYSAGEEGPVIFCLHALGYTGLSWALLAPFLKSKYRIVAMDQRGHGETVTADDGDMNSETRAADVIAVWHSLLGKEQPPTVLVGHAMGGADAIRIAASGEIPSLEGLVCLDVVVWEGTEPVCLPHMMAVVEGRQPQFDSLQAAISWACTSGRTKNPDAARVSFPSMLREVPNVEAGEHGTKWVWRTNASATRPFWVEWYDNLGPTFLSVRVPRLVLMSREGRFTNDLVVAQMQGKYQLQMLPLAGYAIHEDDPELIAQKLEDFMTFFQVGERVKTPLDRRGSS